MAAPLQAAPRVVFCISYVIFLSGQADVEDSRNRSPYALSVADTAYQMYSRPGHLNVSAQSCSSKKRQNICDANSMAKTPRTDDTEILTAAVLHSTLYNVCDGETNCAAAVTQHNEDAVCDADSGVVPATAADSSQQCETACTVSVVEQHSAESPDEEPVVNVENSVQSSYTERG